MCQKLKGVHSKQQLGHMYLPLHWPPSQKKKRKKKQNSGQSLLYQQQTQLIKSKSTWSSGGCIFGKLPSHVLPKNSRPLFPSRNNLLWIHVIIIHGRQRKFWFNLMTNFSCNRYFILFASNGRRTLVLWVNSVKQLEPLNNHESRLRKNNYHDLSVAIGSIICQSQRPRIYWYARHWQIMIFWDNLVQ